MKRNRIIALAIAIVMCLPSIAFANSQELNGNGALISSNPDESVQAAISKNLRLPEGTPTPNTTFLFNAKGLSVDNDTSEAVVDDMPDLNKNLTVSFSSTDIGELEGTTNIRSIINESDNIFHEVDFKEPGVYVYEITEVEATSNGIENNRPYEMVTFSKAVYTMTVYVTWNSDRTATVIYGVGVRVNDPDVSGESENKKIDATPGGDGEKYRHSQLIFTNNYIKMNAPTDPENPDPVNESTLYIKKLTTGNMGIPTQYFDLEITLTALSLLEEKPAFYKAYIVEGDSVINPAANVTGVPIGTDAGGSYIEISTTSSTKFQLRDDQRLVFVDTPIGTSYIVKEELIIGYLQTVQVTTNSVAGGPISVVDNQPLSTGSQLVGDNLNRAIFTANRDSAAPMGIDLNNLPFIGLILLTMVGLIGFVVVKSRRRRYAVEK